MFNRSRKWANEYLFLINRNLFSLLGVIEDRWRELSGVVFTAEERLFFELSALSLLTLSLSLLLLSD